MNREEWIITVPDGNTETRDWSDTCTDILSLFIARLGPVEHLKFGWVCHSWRSARSDHVSVRSPLLLRPKPFFARRCNFVSPVNTRIHSLVVSELFACRVIGAFSKSWLIVRRFPHVFLYNPFTFAKIMLPISFYLYLPSFVAASSSPEFRVLTYSLNCFHSFRVGDRKWLRHRYDNSMGEILEMGEVGGKFYVLTNQGNLGLVDVNDSPVLVWLDKITFEVRSYSYIVESDGELLIVLVAVLGNDFKFYKLDPVTSKLVPTEMRKDEVLYLGMKSVAMRKKGESRVYTVGPSDEIGMFDFSTGKGKVCCDRSCALWMMPELMVRERKPSWWMLCQNLLWLILLMLIFVSFLVFAVIGAVLLFSLALICGWFMLLNYLAGLLRGYHLLIVVLVCIGIAVLFTIDFFARTVVRD